jgi:hypothetical protein
MLRALAAKTDVDVDDLPEQPQWKCGSSANVALSTGAVLSQETTTIFEHPPINRTMLTTAQALSPPQSQAS